MGASEEELVLDELLAEEEVEVEVLMRSPAAGAGAAGAAGAGSAGRGGRSLLRQGPAQQAQARKWSLSSDENLKIDMV